MRQGIVPSPPSCPPASKSNLKSFEFWSAIGNMRTRTKAQSAMQPIRDLRLSDYPNAGCWEEVTQDGLYVFGGTVCTMDHHLLLRRWTFVIASLGKKKFWAFVNSIFSIKMEAGIGIKPTPKAIPKDGVRSRSHLFYSLLNFLTTAGSTNWGR